MKTLIKVIKLGRQRISSLISLFGLKDSEDFYLQDSANNYLKVVE